MKFNVVKAVRYGHKVYEHPEMDELRKTQCLCLNCAQLKPDDPYVNCVIASENYQSCVQHGLVMAVTRCSLFVRKET